MFRLFYFQISCLSKYFYFVINANNVKKEFDYINYTYTKRNTDNNSTDFAV